MTRYPYNNPDPFPQYQQPATAAAPPPATGLRRVPWWGWLLIALSAVGVLSCAGFCAFAAYVGSKGPDTKVYAGHEVPAKYVNEIKSLGLLEANEQIRFFYSDALTDIKNGFYFVSDKKVAVYIGDAATPAQAVPFKQIKEADIVRTTSMLEDSTITLTLTDGRIVSFPVSNELDRDQMFLDTIEKAIPKTGAATPPAPGRR